MTNRPVRPRQPRHVPVTDPRIAIPHSSWSRRDRSNGDATLIQPADFWARLGL